MDHDASTITYATNFFNSTIGRECRHCLQQQQYLFSILAIYDNDNEQHQ
jgi:hypothetical protein